MGKRKRDNRRRPIVSGFVWLGIGVYLLLMSQGLLPAPDKSWPVIIILIGIALIVGAFVRKPNKPDSPHPDNPPPG